VISDLSIAQKLRHRRALRSRQIKQRSEQLGHCRRAALVIWFGHSSSLRAFVVEALTLEVEVTLPLQPCLKQIKP
jgi:hypothetical protein